MSIKTKNTLKSMFAAGTAATQSKFDDLFDSHYNKAEDSVLLGPIGVTGSKGLLGPEGATSYVGCWLDNESEAPGSSADAGSIGQMIVDLPFVYLHTGSSWIQITGATSDF
jgi:hypothetical protein